MSEKIQRYALLELFTAKWGQCDVEWCKASDVAPLEARIEELLRQINEWKYQDQIRMKHLEEQAEEIERLKLEIERVANLGVNAVIKALDKTP